MEVTITALGEPDAQSEYRFREFPITIGRRLDNHISISDPAVSRYHCQIVRVGGTLRIVDLGSQNGIRVNDRSVQQEALADGDVLAVGASRFRVLTGASTTPAPKQRGEATRADNEMSGMDTVSVDPAESTYLQSAPLRGAGRSERDLWILLGLCRAVSERATPEEAQVQLIERLFEAIPAERGAIMLCEQAGSPPSSVLMRTRLRGADTFEISRGVVQQVLQEGRAFLRTRIQDEQEDVPRTMVADQVQAALAVPLMVGGRIIGVLYLDTRRADTTLDRAHLDLATAAAATAAATIESLRRQDLLRARALLIEQQTQESSDLLLLGGSTEAQTLKDRAAERSEDEDPVLLCGPPGSEGARLARWIHRNGPRADGPFVRVRCESSNPAELHRELFGDDPEDTGVRKFSLLEAAFGGTVLIQGAQSIPRECEPQLVRMLRTGAMERRSGAEEIPVNVRIILLWEGEYDLPVIQEQLGADLSTMVGRPIRLAALDDRASDIPAMAQQLAEQAAQEAGRAGVDISPALAAVLKRLSWPLNLAQLRSVMHHAEAVRSEETIEVDDLPDDILETGRAKIGGYHERVYQARRRIILDALDRTNGNYSEAAELLEINRTYLHRLIRTLEMKDEVAERYG